MNTTTLYSLDQNALVNVEFENAIDLHIIIFEHFVKFFGLARSSGEAVQ